MIEIYTDGSCKKNKNGAYGILVLKNKKDIDFIMAKRELNTTNNKMELLGVISALAYCKKNNLKNLTIYSDSKYCVEGINSWMHNWAKKNWKKSNNSNVLNSDLWQRIYTNYSSMIKEKNIKLQWVKAHSTNKFNNKIDNLIQSLN